MGFGGGFSFSFLPCSLFRTLRWSLGLLFLLVCPQSLLSQAAPTPEILTLDQAIILALRENRNIQISVLETEKAQEDLSAQRTHRLPAIQLYMNGGTLLTPVSFTFPANSFGPGIPATDTDITTPVRPTGFMMNSIAQPLSQLYKINLGLRSLEYSRDITRQQLRAKQHQVRNQVTRLYYNLAQTQSALDANLKNIEFYTELDRETDQYLLQEVVLKSESMEVKVRLAREQLDNVKLSNELENQQDQMNQLLARDIRQRFRVSPTAVPTLAEFNLTAAQSRALEQRPEMREAELRTKKADYDRREKKAEYIPDLSLTVQQVSFLNYEMLPTYVANAGLLFSWEPFDWGRKRHELAEKTKTLQQAQTSAKETEAQIIVDVNTQFRKLQEASAAMRVAKLATEAAAEKVRVAGQQYRVQAIRLDQVLQVQADAETKDSQYQKALGDYWTAKADLARAIGDE